jgi:hypothetical protein
MVRGNAKALAQAKSLAKKDSQKQAKSDLKLRGAALKVSCPICKANMINHHQLKMHYDSKHPEGNVSTASGGVSAREERPEGPSA